MKPVRFHPEAESEMIDAAVWYEAQQKDLGKRFLTCVQDALNKIEVHPELYPVVEGDARRCLTKIFPFGVIFRIKPDLIAVMHPHRDPDYWKNRRFEQKTERDK